MHFDRRLFTLLNSGMLLIALGACTPTACNDDERVVGREVDVLVREAGPAAKEAHRRLLARGQESIAVLETGLYHADAMGRARIVKLLVEIGHVDALPILRHMAKRDEDDLVRERARDGIIQLEVN